MSFTKLRYDTCPYDCNVTASNVNNFLDINRFENNTNCNSNTNTNISNNYRDISKKINIESQLLGISNQLSRCSNNNVENINGNNKFNVPNLCNLSMVNFGQNANYSCN